MKVPSIPGKSYLIDLLGMPPESYGSIEAILK